MPGTLKYAVPVLHVGSAAAAERFYCEKLGFARQFAYRPDETREDPCYMGLARDGVWLHLSSFPGDGVSGGVVYIAVGSIDLLHAELLAKGVRIDSGPVDQDWGTRELYIRDADNNSVRFAQYLGDESADRPAPTGGVHPLDAMRAAPDHHAVLLENDQVRVLDTRLRPGERTPVHTHQWPGALYILSWSDFVRRDPQGKVLVDSRGLPGTPPAGSAIWSGPLEPHYVQNVGPSDLHVIAVELKTT